MNFLLVTLDQFRGDCLSSAGHPIVRTPNLDDLAAAGTRLARHYSQAAPCAPGRACLYTGTYQMNNRVTANGTPLDDRFDNVARAARRSGLDPTLFGYTDQGVDPRLVRSPDDPRLSTYEGVLPGLRSGLELDMSLRPWREWLAGLGYDVPPTHEGALSTEPDRPAELGISHYLTDRFLEWQARRGGPWFAHLSYLRPHPPYAAAGHWSAAYRPDDVDLAIAPSDERHPFHDLVLQIPFCAAPSDEGALRRLRSQYYGMIGDVDEQLGRVVEALQESGQFDETFIVVTSDHGEQLGDHGLIQKLGFFEQSYHILGIVRDPAAPDGNVVEAFTENVDVFPTLCEALGVEIPLQCDGLPLGPQLRGESPAWWRTAATWEFDWRFISIPHRSVPWPYDRELERSNLCVRRSGDTAYVQFGDGSWRCYDVGLDPTWRTEVDDRERVLAAAQAMLTWRSEHLDRTMPSFLLEDGGIGRRPVSSPS